MKTLKSLFLTAVLASAAFATHAVEVGVTSTSDYAGAGKRQGYGFTVGEQIGALSVAGGFERFTKGQGQDRYSVVAGYDIYRLGSVTVTPKLGVAYLNNAVDANGYALAVGVGAAAPITKSVDFTVDFARQYGQDRIKESNGNAVVAGLKYKF